MRYTFLLAAVFVAYGAVADATTQRLPESFSYTIFVRGQRKGQSKARVTYGKDAISIASETWVDLGQGGTVEIACQTEVDPQTFRVRTVRFQGVKPQELVKGTTEVSGDSVFTTLVKEGDEKRIVAVSKEGGAIIIEDYDMTFQVLLTRALATSGPGTQHFGLGFASTGALLEAKAGFVSEAAVESAAEEAICRRMVVDITNGSPYMGYYDTERGMPVYLAFPTVLTEAFLDDFYGDEPITRFRKTE